jgi:hypothetical protein
MTSTNSIRVATAALIVAGALSPVALAGGEPKNDWPFTTAVHVRVDRTTAQAQVADVAGEPKNQLPFTRPVAGGSVSASSGLVGEAKNDLPFTAATEVQAGRTAAQAQSPAQIGLGEPKNQLPFTRPVSESIGLAGEAKNDLPFTQPVATPTIVVRSNGFDWGDAGIGVGAGLGIAAVLAGGLLLTYRGSRGHKIGAAATR